MTDDVFALKQKAADFAVEFVQPGMIVGLGSGSTATLAVRRIGERLRAGLLHDIQVSPAPTRPARKRCKPGFP